MQVLEWNRLSSSLPGTLQHYKKDLQKVCRLKEMETNAASIFPLPSSRYNNIKVTTFIITHISQHGIFLSQEALMFNLGNRTEATSALKEKHAQLIL